MKKLDDRSQQMVYFGVEDESKAHRRCSTHVAERLW
jgi:hypothetical protein